jgi:hypothetical protein
MISVHDALPAVQAYLDARRGRPLDASEAQTAAELLEACVRKGRLLVAFALHVAGRPTLN